MLLYLSGHPLHIQTSFEYRPLQRASEKPHATERFLLNIFGSGIDGLFIEIPSGDGLIIVVVVVGQFIIAPTSSIGMLEPL